MKGIYVIEFEIYPGIYKIGCSRNIENRVKQIKGDSLILGQIKVVYQKEFQNFQRAEKLIHKSLNEYRIQQNREFFKVEFSKIKEIVDSLDQKEFISNISKKIEQNRTLQIFQWMYHHINRETQDVSLSAFTRKQICEELQISNNQITNSIRKLKELNLITGDKGTFTLNPEIFWKGDAQTRKQVLEGKSLKISYELI